MIPHGENQNQADVLGTTEEFSQTVVEHGTIGWDGEDEHADLGTVSNDGTTLVKVQLFRGRDTSEPVKDGVSQGHQILARIGGPIWYIPPKGTQCFVVFPGGFQDTPGIGLLVPAYPGKSPSIQFSKTRAVLDFGPDMDVVIKGKSVVLSDYNNRYFAVGPTTGIKCGDIDASGFCLKGGQWLMYVANAGNATAGLKLAATEASMMLNDGQTQGVTMSGGTVTVLGTTFSAKVAIGYLGKAPTVANTIVAGLPTPGAQLASTSWYVSIT
ncbi:MAG TPA: hypothetical protein VFT22_18900 [Kofleriaceae bacterium]|nr:hypothetical protein [Kofleriaceae bacterium]